MNNYPCKDNLWGKCGALGDALRRASEAERKVGELEKEVARLVKKFDDFIMQPQLKWEAEQGK